MIFLGTFETVIIVLISRRKDHLGTAEIPLEGLEHEKETALVGMFLRRRELT